MMRAAVVNVGPLVALPLLDLVAVGREAVAAKIGEVSVAKGEVTIGAQHRFANLAAAARAPEGPQIGMLFDVLDRLGPRQRFERVPIFGEARGLGAGQLGCPERLGFLDVPHLSAQQRTNRQFLAGHCERLLYGAGTRRADDGASHQLLPDSPNDLSDINQGPGAAAALALVDLDNAVAYRGAEQRRRKRWKGQTKLRVAQSQPFLQEDREAAPYLS